MNYLVTENCIKCKYMDCVEVCPVDCFYEGNNMLVIHPDECIDCGVCEPECPPKAIIPDSDGKARAGKPAEVQAGPNGETVYWYPQLPWGHASYAVRAGADGRVTAVEQR